MQYQHLVFEEFARTVQPQIDGFLAPNGYDTTIILNQRGTIAEAPAASRPL